MYKSVDIRDGREVVILDPKWLRAVETLRTLDRQDYLVCQGCNQPVRVRAGEERRPHFAHKHILNCTYSDESASLRNARAVLYEWLVGKFGDRVTIEKRIGGDNFSRPVDCWVEQDTKVFAYWILDTALKAEKREQIQRGFSRLGVNANFVFILDMLRKDKDHPDRILLTTTEREFMRRSDYDVVIKTRFVDGQSLHYLDADNRKMITFRGLHLIHQPQVHKGQNLTADLSEVLVSPKNGEFVHHGEHERLEQYRAEKEALEKRRQQAEERSRLLLAFRKPENERPHTAGTPVSPHFPGQAKTLAEPAKPESSLHSSLAEATSSENSSPQKEGVCVFCGAITTDWWYYDGNTGQCKCRACSRQGKS